MNNTDHKIFFTKPELKDYKGDTSKRWRVEWYEDTRPVTKKVSNLRKHKWLSEKFITREDRYREAERLKKEISDKLSNNKDTGNKVYFINELQRALNYKLSVLSSKNSKNNFIYRANDLKDWLIKNKLEKIEVQDFTKYHASIFIEDTYLSRNLENKTVNGYISYIRPLINYILKTNDLNKDPFSFFEKLRVKETEITLWQNDIRKQLSDYLQLKYPEVYLCVLLTFHCFLRESELLQLKITDIDIDKKVIKIPAIGRKSNKIKYPTISKQLYELLLNIYVKNKDKNQYLFSSHMQPGKKRMCKGYISSIFRKIRKELNIPENYKLYSFKHTGNSLMLEKGLTVRELQLQNGHSETRTTEIYIRRLHIESNDEIFNNSETL